MTDKTNVNGIEQENVGNLSVSYDNAVRRLEGLGQYAELTGVQRAKILLSDMGNPERNLKIIHVAGTNGKGSTCAYIAEILRSCGYSVGLFTSPHLIDIRERIQIDGQMVSKDEFAEGFDYVDSMHTVELAYFDWIFGIAMYIFEKNAVDYVVMETGLGGRLDATNAVENPLISVITAISLEHTAILGDTVDKIAAEKAGIIKKCVPVVLDGCDVLARETIIRHAEQMNAPYTVVDENSYEPVRIGQGYIDFLIHNEYYKNDCFRLSTNALYQTENASIALTVCAVLRQRGMVSLDMSAVREAVFYTHWQGRMERIAHNLYVDGAHNPQGIRSFVKSVDSMYDVGKNDGSEHMQPATLLFSAVSDKNYEEMIKILCECRHFGRVYVTVTGGARKLGQDVMRGAFENYLDREVSISSFDDVVEVMRHWNGELMFAAGSLYLVGDIKRCISLRNGEYND